MRVLVAHGSKMGGTEELARAVGEKLTTLGCTVTVADAAEAREAERYDAIVIGSSLYAGRWKGSCVRLLKHLAAECYQGPVWLFHSGPLGDEADVSQPLPRKVEHLAAQLDTRDVVTFGGRLEEHPSGFIAKAMAKDMAGDWRNWDHVSAWAVEIADELEHGRAA
jgi:menaquinone-dependent protoporphyrinogen oxidase